MGTDYEGLKSAALALSQADRAKLARDLIASLGGPADDDVAEAWDIELCRRIDEIETGQAQLLHPDDFRARIRARVGLKD